MGGSGSGFGGSGGRRWQPEGIDDAILRTSQKEEEAKTAEVFQEALSEINQPDTEAINGHKDSVLQALQDVFPDSCTLHGGGSYTRHTHVEGLSDVDILVDLGPYSKSKIENKEDPRAVLNDMVRRLRERFPNTKITAGRMAVTVQFSDEQELQLLPAFRTSDKGYRVPNVEGPGWTTTRPQIFATMLTQRNNQQGGQLLPCIKLAKVICHNRNIDIKSYHLENIAIKAFEDYTGPRNQEAMLRHLFGQAKLLVNTPMGDVTGQVTNVDRYLTTTSARRQLAKELADAEQGVKMATGHSDEWRELLRLP